MSLQTELEAAKAEVAKLEAEVAALPTTLVGKSEAELVQLWYAISSFFRGTLPPA